MKEVWKGREGANSAAPARTLPRRKRHEPAPLHPQVHDIPAAITACHKRMQNFGQTQRNKAPIVHGSVQGYKYRKRNAITVERR